MEQSPSWKAQSQNSSAFMVPDGLYRVHKSPPLGRILSRISPVHTVTRYLSNIHFSNPRLAFSSGLFLRFFRLRKRIIDVGEDNRSPSRDSKLLPSE
jgi:hypothetical protein